MLLGSKARGDGRGLGARWSHALAGATLFLGLACTPLAAADEFRAWLEGLWPEAQALGVSRATFDSAFKGLTPDLKLPDLLLPGRKRDDSAGQAEFTKTPAQYLNAPHLARLTEQGVRRIKVGGGARIRITHVRIFLRFRDRELHR